MMALARAVLLGFVSSGIYIALTLVLARVTHYPFVNKKWASIFLALGAVSGATLALT